MPSLDGDIGPLARDLICASDYSYDFPSHRPDTNLSISPVRRKLLWICTDARLPIFFKGIRLLTFAERPGVILISHWRKCGVDGLSEMKPWPRDADDAIFDSR